MNFEEREEKKTKDQTRHISRHSTTRIVDPWRGHRDILEAAL
jgi:hypothetical protein